MDSNLVRATLKKIDFNSTTTPLRQQVQTNDFFSSQKQKYDQQHHISKDSHISNINNFSNVSEACK